MYLKFDFTKNNIFFLPILHSVLGTTTPQDPTAILSTRDINPIGEVSDIPHAVTE